MTPEQQQFYNKLIAEGATPAQAANAISLIPKAPPTTEEILSALSSNPDFKKYAGTNDPSVILDAYTTGDWSGVTSITGKPFTDEQQQAAVKEAERVLGPAYREVESYDRATTEDALRGQQESLQDFRSEEARVFGDEKDTLDKSAADQGVLFSGSRAQKLRDLRTTYADRDAIARRGVEDNLRSTTRNYQYNYGGDAAQSLQDLYKLPGATSFNANVAGGQVTPSKTLASAYNPSDFNFQGTKPVAQKAAVQTRAATQLANRANKLTLSGYANKF